VGDLGSLGLGGCVLLTPASEVKVLLGSLDCCDEDLILVVGGGLELELALELPLGIRLVAIAVQVRVRCSIRLVVVVIVLAGGEMVKRSGGGAERREVVDGLRADSLGLCVGKRLAQVDRFACHKTHGSRQQNSLLLARTTSSLALLEAALEHTK